MPSLVEGVSLTLRTLLGDPCPKIGTLPAPSLSTQESISDVLECLGKYWKCFTCFPFGNFDTDANEYVHILFFSIFYFKPCTDSLLFFP